MIDFNQRLNEAITHAVENYLASRPAVAPTPTPTPPEDILNDYFQRDTLVNAFVEKLDNQEWFWNKVGNYVDQHIERVYGAPVTREEVAEVVKELWDEDYESEVENLIENKMGNEDIETVVRNALRDATISIDI
jgi:hypothetical protein